MKWRFLRYIFGLSVLSWQIIIGNHKEIQQAYRLFGADDKCALDVHEGGHVFVGSLPLEWFNKVLKP